MKREIKFRGKAKLDGKWWFGNLVPKDTRGRTQINNPEHGGCFDIDQETVGQFTGLRDKNGKEIYEGDFVRFHMHERGIHESEYQTGLVEFGGGRFYADLDCSTLYFCGDSEDYEVIGNIHDNPELLKEE